MNLNTQWDEMTHMSQMNTGMSRKYDTHDILTYIFSR